MFSKASSFRVVKSWDCMLTLSQTTNFRLFQTERVCIWQFQIWWTWQKVHSNGWKKLWEKEKLVVTSNFSFSHSVFKRHVLQTRKNQGLFGKGLKSWFIPCVFLNKPWFWRVCSTSLLKTLWENEKLPLMCNFSFSHNVFYLFEELSAVFIWIEIVVCRLFHFGRL